MILRKQRAANLICNDQLGNIRSVKALPTWYIWGGHIKRIWSFPKIVNNAWTFNLLQHFSQNSRFPFSYFFKCAIDTFFRTRSCREHWVLEGSDKPVSERFLASTQNVRYLYLRAVIQWLIKHHLRQITLHEVCFLYHFNILTSNEYICNWFYLRFGASFTPGVHSLTNFL